MNNEYKKPQGKKLYDTLKDDISEGGFRNNVSTDFEELKEFFLNAERKKQLIDMGKIKRFFFMAWWLLSELLLKLTPTRRLVLIIGIILLILPGKFGIDGNDLSFSAQTSIFGGILILFVLMLELKDKLVAKDELSAGRSVQRALMSERNPFVKGWKIWLYTQPANDVGGDLVDIIALDNGKHGITIADVSGKGLGAALLMAKLQTIIHALVPENSSLSILFEKLNSAFHKDIMPNSFASMIYFQVFENSNQIEYVNAGHLPPILIKSEEVINLTKGDVALGLTGKATFNSNKVDLNNGEYLVAFSDGVTEARNIFGEFYGTERIRTLIKNTDYISPEQLGQKLLTSVEMFIGEAKKYDDLSVVILKREE